MILVSGAAGKTGQAIIKALAVTGVSVRAFVYRSEHAAQTKEAGAQNVVVGDMQDEVTVRQAVKGVRALYHICPNMNPNEVSTAQTVIVAAKQAGVEHFVYHSVLHPQTEKMPHHWNKLRAEELLFESGLKFTILQPAAYMQNILAGWQTIVKKGRYRVPYPVDTRLAMVDLEDVAQVAATVLTESGHAEAIYELTGPDAPTQTEIAQILSDALGRPIEAEQIPLKKWTEGAKSAGLGDYQISTLIKMFQYYEQYQFLGNSNVLGWLLKRKPTDFCAFAKRVVTGKA